MKVNYSIYNHRGIRDGINSGKYALRVVGSQKIGFRLGGEYRDCVHLFGQTYSKQTIAVAYGKAKFSKTAKKLVQSK